MDNFWSTWEVHCWAAAFKYDQYKRDHPGPNKPLCYEAWCVLCDAIDIQLGRDLDHSNNKIND